MSFDTAIRCFRENKELLAPVGTDARAVPLDAHLLWNLNNGLVNMVQAVHFELAQIRLQLQNIEDELEHLR